MRVVVVGWISGANSQSGDTKPFSAAVSKLHHRQVYEVCGQCLTDGRVHSPPHEQEWEGLFCGRRKWRGRGLLTDDGRTERKMEEKSSTWWWIDLTGYLSDYVLTQPVEPPAQPSLKF